MEMKGKIKHGSIIMQDHRVWTWPECATPRHEYAGETYQQRTKDPDRLFDLRWVPTEDSGYWRCTAHGYGADPTSEESYGCGAIYTSGKDSVEIVE